VGGGRGCGGGVVVGGRAGGLTLPGRRGGRRSGQSGRSARRQDRGVPARARSGGRADSGAERPAGRRLRPRGQRRQRRDQGRAVELLIVQTLNALFYASILFLIACGLTLVYGVMRIVNMAHGNFYAVGAYVAAWTIGLAAAAKFPTAILFFLL